MSQAPADLHPLVLEYLHELHVLRQLSPHTLKAYRMDLSELQALAADDAIDLLKVSNAHVRRWAGRLHSKGKSSRTIARALSAWRGWYDWLTEKDARRDTQAGRVTANLVANPVDDVKAPKRLKSLPKALSVEQADISMALFISATGARLSPRTVQARLRTLAMRAGLPTHVHPHMMRHSFASHVLQSSQDLRAVQEMLGHASIASTQIYTSLDFQHLAQAYDKAHPRAKAGKA